MKKEYLLIIFVGLFSLSAHSKRDIYCDDNLAEWYSEEDLKRDRELGMKDEQICHFYPRRPLPEDPRWLPDLVKPFLFTLRTSTHLFLMDTRFFDALRGRGRNFLHFNWESLANTPWTDPWRWDGGRVGGHMPYRHSPGWFHKEVREALRDVDMDPNRYTNGGARYYIENATPRLNDRPYDNPRDQVANATPALEAKTYVGIDAKGNACSIHIEKIDHESFDFPALRVTTNYHDHKLLMVPGSVLDWKLNQVKYTDRFWAGHLRNKLVINNDQAYDVELYLEGNMKEPSYFRVQAHNHVFREDRRRTHFCRL